MSLLKTLLFTLLLTLPLVSFATSGEQRTLNFDGSAEQLQVTLSGEKTHTEYRQEQVPSTCYRQVFVGYYTYCRNVPYQRCTTTPRTCRQVCTGSGSDRTCRRVCTGGQRVCKTYYRRVCEQRPRYRTEAYTCWETVTVPYEVFDYNTQANVTVFMGSLPCNANADEDFKVNFSGENISLKVKGSGKLITFQADKNVEVAWENNVKVMNVTYDVAFQTVEDAFLPVSEGVSNLRRDGDILSYEIGKVQNENDFVPSLNLKNRWLIPIGKRKLFNGNLNKSQYAIEDLGDKTLIKIFLKKLGVKKFRKRKYFYKVGAELKFDLPIITEKVDLPSLKITKKGSSKFKL